MWLIARRTFAGEWSRLLATVFAMLLSVGLMSGTLHFALRAQAAVSGSDAAEYARADVLVLPAVPGSGPEADGDAPAGESAAAGRRDGGIGPAQVAAVPGVAAVAGDVSVPVTVVGTGGTSVVPPAGGGTSLRPWIADPRLNAYDLVAGRAPAADGEVAVIRHVAEAGDLAVGSTATLLLAQETRKVTVVGVVTVEGLGTVTSGDVVLAAPETVRRAAGLPEGAWRSLWVKAAPGVTATALRDTLRSRLAAGPFSVLTAADVRAEESGELAGMGVSLGGAVGMLAIGGVFVGLFVVSNTFGALVRQRTRQLALLAAIGARPRQIKRLVRLEALAVGVVASAGGVPVGYGISQVLTWLLARDGLDVSAGETRFGWVAVAVPFVLGVLTAQLAVRRPARRAAGVAPIEALRSVAADTAGRARGRLLGALGVFALSWIGFGPAMGIAATEPPGVDRTMGIMIMTLLGAMICVSALAMLAPFFAGPLGGLVGRLAVLVSGEPGRLARATITRNPTRVSSAAASLMLGVMMVVSMGSLASSVRDRFLEAGNAAVTADHVIIGAGGIPLPSDVAALAARVPGVTAAVGLTRTYADVVPPAREGNGGAGESPAGKGGGGAGEPSAAKERGEAGEPVAGEEEETPAALEVVGASRIEPVLRFGGRPWEPKPGEIALSSSAMEARGVRVGERITLRGPSGEATLAVAHRYHDPSHLIADQALVHSSVATALDRDAPTTAVFVRGTAAAAALERAVAEVPVARVQDRSSYVREAAGSMLRGLDLIHGFVGMALLISLFGMATTVSLGVSERTREFGMLGAVGTTMRQIRSIVRWEAATVVLLGVLLGTGAGVGTMALLDGLTGSSFIRVAVPPWLLVLVVGAAVLVTFATTALPARRAAAVPVLDATKA
ncbi:ABC transporter [Planomonospora sphaerica]|uniref:ABC transporter n=1 Tax=Planomonospora sphaerica TaxID=161355 RepID=A0A161LML2_9ACTN|nr:ABC transporter permease [Planomonospora sphaerica]GAT70397.1 ABC transporter [Planomonospora sphaerica]